MPPFEQAENSGLWAKIRAFFAEMFRKLGLSDYFGKMTDNELRYVLWRSYEWLKDPKSWRNPFAEAEDVVKRSELKVGEFADGKEATLDELVYACTDELRREISYGSVSRRTVQHDLQEMRYSEVLGYYAPIIVVNRKFSWTCMSDSLSP